MKIINILSVIAVTTNLLSTPSSAVPQEPTLCPAYASRSDSLEVIVVGAGLAGLTAAKTLFDNGVSFYVIERLDEVGGRMRTIDSSEHGFSSNGDFAGILEAGANWMNGGRGKSRGRPQPVKTLADDYNVLYYDQSFDEIQLFDDSKEVRYNKMQKEQRKALGAFECLSEDGATLYAAYASGNPIQETQSAKDTLEDCGWTPGTEIEKVFENYYIEQDYILPTKHLSSYNFPDDTYFDFGQGDNFVSDQNVGLQGIAVEFSEEFLTRGENLFLSSRVEYIDYANGSTATATVTVTDSDDKTCDIKATTVIYTPSLGILEKYKDSGFNPPIDTTKLPLVMGTWNKIFFQFDNTFWLEEHQWIMLATTEKTCKLFLNYNYYWNKWTKLLPGSNILACFMDETAIMDFNGDTSTTIDVDDRAVTDALLKGLEKAFGSLPSYTAFATDWMDEDKYGTLGSWENWKYDPNNNIGLTEYFAFFDARENGRLIISGSASCNRYWGTMTGAYYAGIKAGEWAINILNGNLQPPYSVCDDLT